MTNQKKIYLLLALGVVLALAVWMLQKNRSGGGGGSNTAAHVKLTPEELAGKKIFVSYRDNAFRSLDPQKQFDEASREIIYNLYDTLLDYAYLERPLKIQPSLLTKMPERQGKSLVYRLELRPGVMFNDDACFPGGKGREMTVDDVIYTFKRFADANVNQLSYMLMGGTIVGMDEFRKNTQKLGKLTDYSKMDIPGIKKIDSHHMTVELTSENPVAFYPWAASQMSIIPPEGPKHYGEEFDRHPTGSGPFFIKDMTRRGAIVLAKNSRYWQKYPTTGEKGDKEAGRLEKAGQAMPFVDEVHMPLIEEPQASMLSFLNGEIDHVVTDKDNFSKMAFKQADGTFKLKPEFEGKVDLFSVPDLSVELMSFNMKDPIVGGYEPKNKALRQAIAYAFDAVGFIDLMKNGRANPLKTLIPIGIPGSERDVPTPEFMAYNLEMAKKKLVEAGYPGGKGLPTLTVEYRASTTMSRQEFEYTRALMEKIGITLKGNFQTFSAWLKRVETGNFQMCNSAWGADYPDAENFYQLNWTKSAPPGPNYGAYSNAAYDKMYEQIKSMPNGPERYKIFEQMNKILFDDMNTFVMFNRHKTGFVNKWVRNYKWHTQSDPPLRYVDVDLKAKAGAQ